MIQLFTVIFYQPLWNALVMIYNFIPGHDIGWSIILLTIAIKVILFPFSLQSLRSQKAMQTLQPKISALKAQYKDNKEKQASAMMELYKNEKVSPLSSCLPLLIQFPILIALYQVLQAGLGHPSPELLYGFVRNPGTLDPNFLGVINLSSPNYILAILAGIFQFIQTKMIQVKPPPAAVSETPAAKDESTMAMMNKQMLYVMPVMTVFIGAGLPGGLTLYWLVNNIVTVIQQFYFLKRSP